MNDKVNKKMLKFSGVCAIILVLSLLIVGVFELTVMFFEGRLEYVRAGERWSSDGERFAVISLYTEDGSAFSADQALSWAYSIDKALLESSISAEDGARAWAYSYSCEDTLTLRGPKGNSTAQVIAAGGDFFVFHPMKFVYGSAFLNDGTNPMGIVIDRELAWDVFGAENIIGMTVEIGGYEFVVTGVCEPESKSGIYGYTYGDRPRMYMSYAGYTIATGNNSGCTVFEAALPNAVSAFAKNIFDKSVTVNEDTAEVIEVTERFSIENRFNNMKTLKYSWIRENKIGYPYWENEAKVYDFYSAVMMIFEVFFVALAVVTLLLSLITVKFSGYSLIYDVRRLAEKRLTVYKKTKNI